ncbi:MAG: TetR family transcriptional regulator C-terminal domain-containing protein [Ruminococcus sp.]|nr:TetR family transcriptional regulator C-terminal domain-containing protein [Ruminococcus sp.]
MTSRNRRVRRTRQFLEEGLLQLMQEKSIKNITVRELTERVAVNRSTFYLHYMDIFDMVDKMEEQLFEDFYYELNAEENSGPLREEVYHFMEVALSFLERNRRTVLILCSQNGDHTFLKRMEQMTKERAKVWIRSLMGKEACERQVELATAFFCSGCVSMVADWLISPEREDPREILKMMFQLVLGGSNGFTAETGSAGEAFSFVSAR